MWNILSILGVFSIGLVTPGPDFSIVVRNSLSHGRKAGFFTALGIAAGIALHLSYCIFGLGVLIGKSTNILTCIRILGGMYLIYLGYRSFTSKPPTITTSENKKLKSHSSFIQGFFTNLLNPNAVLFFISIFSSVLAKDSIQTALILGFGILFLAFSWFSIVSYMFSIAVMVRKYLQFAKWMNFILGCVLIFFGLSILSRL